MDGARTRTEIFSETKVTYLSLLQTAMKVTRTKRIEAKLKDTSAVSVSLTGQRSIEVQVLVEQISSGNGMLTDLGPYLPVPMQRYRSASRL